MARRKGGRRGRRYNPDARRHQTDRAGRRGDVDTGSPWLVARKLQILGRTDLELSAASLLHARGHLDRVEYDTLSFVAVLLGRIARAFGRGYSVHALWSGLLAAGSAPTSFVLPIIGDSGARRQISAIVAKLNGSRSMVIDLAEGKAPPIALRAASGHLRPADYVALEELRQGLREIHVPGWAREDASFPRQPQDVVGRSAHPVNEA
jgi:hypothetical protein